MSEERTGGKDRAKIRWLTTCHGQGKGIDGEGVYGSDMKGKER